MTTTLCNICEGVFDGNHLADAHPNEFFTMDFDPDTETLTIIERTDLSRYDS